MTMYNKNEFADACDYYEACVRVFHEEISEIIMYGEGENRPEAIRDAIHFVKSSYKNMYECMPVID